MKPAGECADRLHDLVAMVMGELEPSAARELLDHVALCHACRQVRDLLAEEEKEVQSAFEELVPGLGPIERLLDQHAHVHGVRAGASSDPVFRRFKTMILTHKRLSATVGAVTVLAASLAFYVFLFSSSGQAYAMEQTEQANRRITSYHVKVTPAPIESMNEAWIELNPDGSVLRSRLEFFSADDGPKISIVSRDRAEVWFKMKRTHVITSDKTQIERARKQVEAARLFYDPKLAFEYLMGAKKAGQVQVETRQPIVDNQPVTLTVTSKQTPDRQEVYEVDQQSKLVERVFEMEQRKDHGWQLVRMREYLDYNKEFEPSVFQPETPKGYMTVDWITNEVGVNKGSSSDDEIATKVAREFFEALIAKDYQKASPLFSGIPAEQLKKLFREMTFLRIVEIGKPTLETNTHALSVPVKVEIEVNGVKSVREFSPGVRAESEGRWTIINGI